MKQAILISTIVLALCSCNGRGYDVSGLVAERDSALEASRRQQLELEDLHSFVAVISDGLDSIAAQEGVLLSNKTQDGYQLSRKQIRENLKTFGELLERQRLRIRQLEDNLKDRTDTSSTKLKTLIGFLNNQLEEKDKTIRSLQKELARKDTNISRLQSDISELKDSVTTLEEKAQIQEEALQTQDVMLNECYLKIGTRKQLQSENLLTGGLLSKKKVNHSGIDLSKFTKVDIRQFREIRINGKNARILTAMPESSYQLTENRDGTCTLVITDPTAFWSISNYLIIQIK